jgi:hypothetical protein
VTASLLAHLPPKTRLRFIAWLLVAGRVQSTTYRRNGAFPASPC